MKKKYIATMVIAAALLNPAVCFPSYIIALSNGHNFITEEWWTRKEEILFYQYGGVVGLNRETINKIHASELPVPGLPASPQKTAIKNDPVVLDSTKVGEPETAAKGKVSDELEQALRLEKQLLDNRRIAAVAVFYKAKSSTDREAFKKAQKNISQIDREIQALQKKALEIYGDEAPEWLN